LLIKQVITAQIWHKYAICNRIKICRANSKYLYVSETFWWEPHWCSNRGSIRWRWRTVALNQTSLENGRATKGTNKDTAKNKASI